MQTGSSVMTRPDSRWRLLLFASLVSLLLPATLLLPASVIPPVIATELSLFLAVIPTNSGVSSSSRHHQHHQKSSAVIRRSKIVKKETSKNNLIKVKSEYLGESRPKRHISNF